MAGVFTLNTNPLPPCVCEARILFFLASLRGCRLLSPITILLYFPSIPTSPLLLLSNHLQVYTSRFCTHRSAGPHKCSSSPRLAATVAGSQGLGSSYCSFLKQDSEDLSLDHLCNEGKENHMRGCISVISLRSRINESLWRLGIERYKKQLNHSRVIPRGQVPRTEPASQKDTYPHRERSHTVS